MKIMLLRDDDSEKVHYDYGDYPMYIQRAFLSSYPNYRAPSHWHDDIELIAVLSGEMQYNINGERVTLKAQEGILVNARQMHFGFSDSKEECEFLCILLHPMLLCVTPAYERDFVLPLINHDALQFVHLRTDIPWQRDICSRIKFIYSVKEKSAAQMKIQAAFMTIWTLLYENIPPADNGRKRQTGDLAVLKNMIGFIQQNYVKKISLSDIAVSGAVGQSKCCKLFARYLGQTPNLYLTQYRLNKSMELLKNTDMAVTEIAVETGFGGGSYYAETFRKWIGKSPTEYRREQNFTLSK